MDAGSLVKAVLLEWRMLNLPWYSNISRTRLKEEDTKIHQYYAEWKKV